MLTFMASHGNSQQREQVFTGARPLGMGETFVAIANDGNTIYWNPAGLPSLKRLEFNSMYGRLYDAGLENGFLGFVLPITHRLGLGASWFRTGFGDNELEYFRNITSLAMGVKVHNNLLLGTSLKYLSTDTKLAEVSLGKAGAVGFDLGALLSLPLKNMGFLKQINMGIMAHDVGGAKIRFDDSSSAETILPQNIRLGLAFLPKKEISLKWFTLKDALLAFDFDDRFHLGAEAWPLDNLAVRAGIQKDFHTDEGITSSFGGSLRFKTLQLDYAYNIPPVLPATHLFSFSFTRSPSPVKITGIKLVNERLFASFYKTYAATRIGSAIIRNDYDKELPVTIKTSIPGLTATEITQRVMLPPNESPSIHFSVVLPNILTKTGHEYHQVKIRVDYKTDEDKYVEDFKEFELLGRGAITWDDPGKAAAFITKRDRWVELFASEATKNLPYRPEVELGNIYKAACLFEAMGAVGIRYEKDKPNPFSTILKDQDHVDEIKYPIELLTGEKKGDCDDLTVLYASLLENSGVRTALVSTEKHITVMFDTGIHERKWGLLPLADSLGNPLIVLKNQSIWIPVEITEVGSSFSKAWETGGQKYYQDWRNDKDFMVKLVQEVEGIYLSPSSDELPEELQNQRPDLPDPARLRKMFERDSSWIQARRTNYAIKRYQTAIQTRSDSLSLRNKLGIIFVQQDSIAQAEKQFRTIIKSQPNDQYALVNLANLYCIAGEFKEAEEHYSKAEKQLGNEPGLYLNFAILYQLWRINSSDSLHYQTLSEQNFLHALDLLKGNKDQALELLGISEDLELGEKADLATWANWAKEQAVAIKRFIKDGANKYILNKSVTGARVKRKGVKRGYDKDRSYILWWAYNGHMS